MRPDHAPPRSGPRLGGERGSIGAPGLGPQAVGRGPSSSAHPREGGTGGERPVDAVVHRGQAKHWRSAADEEAFDIYRRHLRPDGFIAAHITNACLNLYPVVNRQYFDPDGRRRLPQRRGQPARPPGSIDRCSPWIDRCLGWNDRSPGLIDPCLRLIDRCSALIDQPPALIDRCSGLIDQPPALIDRCSGLIDQPPALIDRSARLIFACPESIAPSPELIDRAHGFGRQVRQGWRCATERAAAPSSRSVSSASRRLPGSSSRASSRASGRQSKHSHVAQRATPGRADVSAACRAGPGPPLCEMVDAGQGEVDRQAQAAPHYEFDPRIAGQRPHEDDPIGLGKNRPHPGSPRRPRRPRRRPRVQGSLHY